MLFKEKDFVIVNLVKKTQKNIIGIDTIPAIQVSKDRVIDFKNYKVYEIIRPFEDKKEGEYVKIINRPFKDSTRMVSTKYFKSSECKKYIKIIKEMQEDFYKSLDNPERISEKNREFAEDEYLYVDKKPKIFQKNKVIKK